jgi:hypothetical protein
MNTQEYDYLLLLQKMPEDIVRVVSEFLPIRTIVWLNKEFYIKYYKKIRSMIVPNLYDNYIRDMVRLDNLFVFKFIARENIMRWMWNKNIIYKNISYSNFLSFLNDFTIKNNSTNCRNLLKSIFNETCLSKNRHKKNRYLNIRWRT